MLMLGNVSIRVPYKFRILNRSKFPTSLGILPFNYLQRSACIPSRFSNIPVALGNFQIFPVDIGIILHEKTNTLSDFSFRMEIGNSNLSVNERERLELR